MRGEAQSLLVRASRSQLSGTQLWFALRASTGSATHLFYYSLLENFYYAQPDTLTLSVQLRALRARRSAAHSFFLVRALRFVVTAQGLRDPPVLLFTFCALRADCSEGLSGTDPSSESRIRGQGGGRRKKSRRIIYFLKKDFKKKTPQKKKT